MTKRTTVKDIAKELGVSLSTVNKGLTGKPGISEERRAEVISTADKLGYRVNKVAQSLARNTIKIGIVIPEDWPQFYNHMENGIQSELDALSDYKVSGLYKHYSHRAQDDTVFECCCQELIDRRVDAVIFCPAGYFKYEPFIERINKHNIPLVLLGNDLPKSVENRLTAIQVDANLSGRLAAEITSLFLPKIQSAAIFIGNKDIEVHRAKKIGFCNEAAGLSRIDVAGVYETQDDRQLAYHLTKTLLENRHDIGCIYVATGNCSAVCQYIKEHTPRHAVKVIGTDISEEMAVYMEDGIVAAMIHQNPKRQGQLAVRTLYQYLSEGRTPSKSTFVDPQIVMRNNIRSFIEPYNR